MERPIIPPDLSNTEELRTFLELQSQWIDNLVFKQQKEIERLSNELTKVRASTTAAQRAETGNSSDSGDTQDPRNSRSIKPTERPRSRINSS